jgi:hypothetical protein
MALKMQMADDTSQKTVIFIYLNKLTVIRLSITAIHTAFQKLSFSSNIIVSTSEVC